MQTHTYDHIYTHAQTAIHALQFKDTCWQNVVQLLLEESQTCYTCNFLTEYDTL